MKNAKYVVFILILLAFGLFFSCEDDNSVTIKNSTSNTIFYIYISHSSEDQWNDDLDILGDDVVLDGDSFTISEDFFTKEGAYDICLVDEDDEYYYFWEVNPAETGNMTMTMENLDLERSE